METVYNETAKNGWIKLKSHRKGKNLIKNWQLYLLLLLPVAYIIIFHYVPIYGILIAFKNYKISKGILGSPWVGFKYFQSFFESPVFWQLIRNTLGISLYSLLAGFPVPVLLALSLNEIKNGVFKKTVQLVTYAPHFISTVVLTGMIIQFLSPRYGAVTLFLKFLGVDPGNILGKSALFSTIYVLSGIWQSAGYNAIIYIAALSSVDVAICEAATIDGATRLQKIFYVFIPTILPTMVIIFILNCGHIMSVGFEKVYLLQNQLNLEASEVISTYVYKIGLQNAQYSFSTAVGLFNSVINLVLIATVNKVARALGETSLW